MKHLLNDMTEKEKNAIREQHTGGIKVMTEKFSKLLNSKLGDAKPILEQSEEKTKSGIVGKTVTFYTNKKDAEAASAAGKSNPSSTDSILGKITRVENTSSSKDLPSSDEFVFGVNFEYLENRDDRSEYYVVYNRTKGSFSVRAWPGVEYYNESLRKFLDSTYFTTDFAKNSGGVSVPKSDLASSQKPLGSEV
jgi:hypothetical protein